MKAKELIEILEKAVSEYGDRDILLIDSESSWYNSVKGISVVNKTKLNPYCGFQLEIDHDF